MNCRAIYRVRFWGGLLAMLLLGTQNPLLSQEMNLGSVVEKHEMIPMRDGKKLSVYLYFPQGEGPWPVLYEQRYAGIRSARSRETYAELASHGYVVAAQNFRGSHRSEGVWVGYRALGWGEKRDGFDTVEWLGEQSWSTGKVGSFGSSQAGYAQNFLAVTQPPHLVAQYMIDTGLSLFHLGYRVGGTTRPQRFLRMVSLCCDPEEGRNWLAETFRHPTYDEYWQQEDCTRHFDKMNVPAFSVGSWYDFMSVGSIDSFTGRQHHGGPAARGRQKLLIGPWLHGSGGKDKSQVGELMYPEDAAFPLYKHLIHWFDHYLKGIDNGAEAEPAVRYYVMGAVGEQDAPGNVWRDASDWPVPAQTKNYYLQRKQGAEGSLSPEAPDSLAGTTTYFTDPANPARTPGPNFPGAQDARDYEKQPEVRTFTTEPLSEPVEWTGTVRAELFVSSSARDTDFIVRISDVYPDGRSILIIDSILRARYREGFNREVFMEPGTVYRITFDIGALSQIFNKGHRIRATVASTGAPYYEPNPNTGELLTIKPASRTIVAKNTVYHNRRYASRLIAPVRGK